MSRLWAGSSSRATTVTSRSWTRCSRTGPTRRTSRIYEFTVVRDADGAYQPALVDSWEVSDDLLTWTFKIREGLTFQSGAALDAQMIADNFNAFRDATGDADGPGQNAIFWPTVDRRAGSGPDHGRRHDERALHGVPGDARDRVRDDREPRQAHGARRRTTARPRRTARARSRCRASSPAPRSSSTAGTPTPARTSRTSPTPGPPTSTRVKWVPILEAGQRANEIEGGTVNVVKNPAGQDIERLQANGDLVTVELPEPLELLHRPQRAADGPRIRRRQRPPGDLARDRPAVPRRLDLLRPGRRDLRADRAELQVVRGGRRAVQPVRPGEGEVAARRSRAGPRAPAASARRAARSSRSRSRATTTTSRPRPRSTRRSCRCWRTWASR